MKLKMIGKLLMMTGLLALSSQTPTMASETQVTLQVPVNISNVSDADARHMQVSCGIYPPGGGRYKVRVQQRLQMTHGAYSGVVTVRLQKPRHRTPFKAGDTYQCGLSTGGGGQYLRSSFAKPGTHPVIYVRGTL